MDGSSRVSELLGQDVERWGMRLRYAVDPHRLGTLLSARFQPATLDTEGEGFVAAALTRPHRRAALTAHRLFTLFLSDFDANALLGMYPVFLMSTPQARSLIDTAAGSARGRQHLLDIGAGSGDVTTRLAPLVERVTCAEASRYACRRLRRRGLHAWQGEAGAGRGGDPLVSTEGHDIVALFNVLDRCAQPRRLLQAATAHLPRGGLLLLSVPLPYRPFFYSGSATREPEVPLRVPADAFEEAAQQLWSNELEPLGLSLGAIARMPYLSGGDARHVAYVLDAVVFALRKD